MYLDHAGTVPYSKSLMDRYSTVMMSTLYGNPHSISTSSQRSTQMIDDARLELLRFLKADPAVFDLVFVANATAGVKLVAEAFRDQPQGFTYVYHDDSHTSLVGVRELATHHLCLSSDDATEAWLRQPKQKDLCLFAYPAQSNMNGRRLPLKWCQKSRRNGDWQTYSLLDAAARLSTSPLDLSDTSQAPDFTVFSLYKIFGFPDLGALVVRKAAASILQRRRYFGGGTVDVVTVHDEQWHVKKSDSLHSQLEDGTLPIHSIAAVQPALAVHAELFESMEQISKHTAWLAQKLQQGLLALRHANDTPVVKIYGPEDVNYRDTSSQGPTVAFNLRDGTGAWLNHSEVIKLATIRHIHIRTGGLCNPGGIASSLKLEPWEMRDNFSAGHRCGGEDSIANGKPIGVIRASLGATSTLTDVERFLAFLAEFFVQTRAAQNHDDLSLPVIAAPDLVIETLTVYPVKSCAGYKIPKGETWSIGPEGMQWDREWCIVHQGTGAVLSQKQYPRMALLQPTINTEEGELALQIPAGTSTPETSISVPLSHDPRPFKDQALRDATTCDDKVEALCYESDTFARSLSDFLGVQCQLARFPPAKNASSSRHSKAHLVTNDTAAELRPIMFSNESPILTINRSSLDALNQSIATRVGESSKVSSSAFRANIVLASPHSAGQGQAWAEDGWLQYEVLHEETGNPSASLESRSKEEDSSEEEARPYTFDVIGPCRRCHMICIDQSTGERQAEPFVTLAKTRRLTFSVCSSSSTDIGGLVHDQNRTLESRLSGTRAKIAETMSVPVKTFQGVFFGVHTALADGVLQARIRVGDAVRATRRPDSA